MADKLGDFIVGTALETIETEKLIKEFEQGIVKDVYENNTPVDKVVHDLQGYIQSKGIQMNRVVMDDVYQPSSMAERNVTTWLTSKNVESGRSSVTPVSTVVDHESLRMVFYIWLFQVMEPRLRAGYNVEKSVAPVSTVDHLYIDSDIWVHIGCGTPPTQIQCGG